MKTANGSGTINIAARAAAYLLVLVQGAGLTLPWVAGLPAYAAPVRPPASSAYTSQYTPSHTSSAGGREAAETVPVHDNTAESVVESAPVYEIVSPPEPPVTGESASALIRAAEGGIVALEGAAIEIPAGALEEDTEISITRLYVTEAVGETLDNATAGGGGYRFLPAGTRFRKPVTVRLPYDSALAGRPAALRDLNSYYYDTLLKRWEALEKIGLDGEKQQLISATTHFTDMINGTLALPEGPKPLSFDINSIKGLEAADPSAGVIPLEGLDANYTGSAGFRFALPLPPGRAGMVPSVAVSYSSDGGNGILGKGFSLETGGEITYDTRRGLPEYGAADSSRKNKFLLDGTRLRYATSSGSSHQYRPLKEQGFEKILHHTGAEDYWEVTDKNGTVRIYGRSGSWTGRSAGEKYRWLLESVTDSFGNAIHYEYEIDSNEAYLTVIYYTGAGNDRGPYQVHFIYDEADPAQRPDVQVNGRGKFIAETKKRLDRIETRYNDQLIKSWRMEYTLQEYYGHTQMIQFGEDALTEGGQRINGEYLWAYGFDYENFEKDGDDNPVLFGEQETWTSGQALQVQQSVSGGADTSTSVGVGIGTPWVDARFGGGARGAGTAGSGMTEQTMVDVNGDGRPDLVRKVSGGIAVALNTGLGGDAAFKAERFWETGISGLEKERSGGTSVGGNISGGVGMMTGMISAGVSTGGTRQSGWNETETGWVDIDGDGLPDLVEKGKSFYWRNTGIGFERVDLLNEGELPDREAELSVEEKEQYNKYFYQQRPLRAWRAFYSGTVELVQSVSHRELPGGTAPSPDGFTGELYHAKAEDTLRVPVTEGKDALVINGEKRSDGGTTEISLAGGENLYFLSNPGRETRGDDVAWNIKIRYTAVKPFERFQRTMRYYPPDGTLAIVPGGLGSLYNDMDDSNNEKWMLRSDWRSRVTPVIANALIVHGYFIPEWVDEEEFEELWNHADESAKNYLSAYFLYDAGRRRYITNYLNEDALRHETWPRPIPQMGSQPQYDDGEYTWELIALNVRNVVQKCNRESLLNGVFFDGATVRPAPGDTRYSVSASYEDYPYFGRQDGMRPLDEIEGEELFFDETLKQATWGERLYENAVAGTDPLTITIPVKGTDGEALYDIVYTLSAYTDWFATLSREELELIWKESFEEKSWEEFLENFPWYEEDGQGSWVLKPLPDPDSEDEEEKEAYKKAVQDIKQKIKASSLDRWMKIKKSIHYYFGGSYPVEGNAVPIMTLKDNTFILDRFEVESWDSASDFEQAGTDRQSPHRVNVTEEGGAGQMAIAVERLEPLYGGEKQWYYGIWNGEAAFSEEELYRSKTESRGITAAQILAGNEGLENTDPPMDGEVPLYAAVRRFPQAEDGEDYFGDSVIGSDEETGKALTADLILVGPVSTVPVTGLERGGDGSLTSTGRESHYFPFIQGDLLHHSRAGGSAYYEIRGIAANSGGTGMNMPTIRKSRNSGTDTVVSISVNFSPSSISNISEIAGKLQEYADKLKAEKEYSESGIDHGTIVSLEGNKSTNNSTGTMYQSVQDINGDGYADLLYSDGGFLNVQTGNGRGFAGYYNAPGITALSVNENNVKVMGGSLGVNGSARPIYIKDKLAGVVVLGSAGMTGSNGDSTQLSGLADMNGDGLPDYYAGFIALNLGDAGFQPYSIGYSGTLLNDGESRSLGVAVPLGFTPNSAATSSNTGSKVSIEGSFNASVSSSASTVQLVDVNGDGLPDVAEKNGTGAMAVRFNRGRDFTEEQAVFPVANWDLDFFDTAGLLSGADAGVLSTFISGIPLIGGALNKIGFDSTAVERYFVNPFGSGGDLNSLDYSTSRSITIAGSLNVQVTGNILIIPMFGIWLNITGSGGGGVNLNATVSGASSKTMDMDGDGLPDRVLRIPGSDHIYVRRNLSGKVGLLKTISAPQGGTTGLEYEYMPGTPEMPQGKYVLSRVTQYDGDGEDGRIRLQYDSVHEYTTEFEYEDGYYDRVEKESYGFATVTTRAPDNTTQVTRNIQREYHLKGMPQSQIVYNTGWNSETIYTYDNAPNALVLKTQTTREENGERIRSALEYRYDNYGNVEIITDTADGVDDLTAEIAYWHNDNKYFHAHPREITVKSGGNTIRRRSGSYHIETGALTSQTAHDGRRADISADITTNITWDAYGNIAKMENGAWVEYQYDNELHQYPVTIARGGSGGSEPSYRSFIEWNTQRGLKTKEVDENGQEIRYEYDQYGRLAEVYSPYDEAIPAVKYDYHERETGNWYAVTENKVSFDPGNAQVLRTVIVIDGLGRAIVTGKDGEVRKNGADIAGWNIAGGVSYDHKGRTTAQGQAGFMEGNDIETLLGYEFERVNGPYGLKYPTLSEYDTQDRTVKTSLPDGSVQTSAYAILGGGKTLVTAVDPLGNISEQTADSRGNIVEVRRKNAQNALLTKATYEYNAIGEMLKAVDVKGFELSVEYDWMGRRTAMQSADMGRKEYYFDSRGNLSRENDSVLRGKGTEIKYEYDDLNRLVRIDYPNSKDTVYEYGGPDATDGTANRIAKVTDETGTTEYEYGALGETVKETRTIRIIMPQAGQEDMKTKAIGYKSNYLGQIEEIVFYENSLETVQYPETVRYGYNAGGQIRTVTGSKTNIPAGIFEYVRDIGYDEFGQRVFIEYGNGVKTTYTYNPERRWLDKIVTTDGNNNTVIQNMTYDLDRVGNVNGYVNDADLYKTEQSYAYDDLYQLISVNGSSMGYNGKSHSVRNFYSVYSQNFAFDVNGNMTAKSSTEKTHSGTRNGDNLNYNLDYQYYDGYAHRAKKIGDMYYTYDGNGNLLNEQFGSPASSNANNAIVSEENGVYSTDYGFALIHPDTPTEEKKTYRRDYLWNERNQLIQSVDDQYTVRYRYGADGNRSNKFAERTGFKTETLYFSRMYQVGWSNNDTTWMESKHIFVGDTRIVTKRQYEGIHNFSQETEKQYFYHGDHLGSAQMVTDYTGQVYEHLEYTPYGELWVEHAEQDKSVLDKTTFRFTGKERDAETGLYYYGARYLNPQTGLWLSTDPAMGEYVPAAPINDDVRKQNQNLPGMGGVFNVVNLHAYHYAGNNPVKYVDPDGEWIIHIELFRGTSGFGHDAPQSLLGYFDIYDDIAQVVTSIHGTRFDLREGRTLRLWKGDYGALRKLLPSEIAQFVGSAGGEIGFYNTRDGSRMSRTELFFGLGLISTEMNLYEKGTNRWIVGFKEILSFWTNDFSWFEQVDKNNVYTVNTFKFRNEKFAANFEQDLLDAKPNALKYLHNEKEDFAISRDGKTVTVVWGVNSN